MVVGSRSGPPDDNETTTWRQPGDGFLSLSLGGTRLPRLGSQEQRGEEAMSVAKVTELSSTSDKSFEDAIEQGIARATKTLRNVKSAWIKEQEVEVADDRVTTYKVNMLVTFVLDDEI
jgi:dodecin